MHEHEHVASESAVLVIEGHDAPAIAGQSSRERLAWDPVGVVEVQRVAELVHHVVGDINDVRDRTDARGVEPSASQ